MNTLFEIGDEVRALVTLIDEAGEEPSQEALAALDSWFADLRAGESAKIDGYIGLIRDRELVAAARNEEAERHEKAARVANNLARRLKDRLLAYLLLTGQQKIDTGRNVVRVQGNGGMKPLQMDGEPATLPPIYQRLEIEADTAAIRQALEAGETIPGCRLGERGKQLRIT